jgi:hypothetical protein
VGVSVNLLKFLFVAHFDFKVNLGNCLTIGRQEIFFDKRAFDAVKRRFRAGPEFDVTEVKFRGYADDIISRFGASKITTMDASDYEGATFIHDLNEPVGKAWCGQFDSIVDFGSIEHVFSTESVLRNYANLVRLGGVVLIATEADGSCGHGLYQFSPELFYRFYSVEAGFRTHCFLAPRDRSTRKWIYVPDPMAVRGRLELPSLGKMHLLVVAVKCGDGGPAGPIQQSDYVAVWAKSNPPRSRVRSVQLAIQYNARLFDLKSRLIDTFVGRELFRAVKLRMLPVRMFYPWQVGGLQLEGMKGANSARAVAAGGANRAVGT